ncbi:acetyl-CoA C-acetyltransferase [Salsipaludibacter albus]|uniref:acetyl-CoA C-acetyltransferase n=1 Tax=Salsipaludibacter albus TaxID=2849650 RepID=UPI001EE4CE28|nr:acetyl-CoA C-acetyltransferase [Salsipaludibacter albus]MBY5161520.1 acetyl-CoA C-acetyltransferase [Salsipaludibacter albus]
MTEAYVYDAVRTPRGRGKDTGALHTVKPVTLASTVLEAVRERNPGLDPALVDDVVMGIVEPHGDQGGVLPRTAVLAAGYPEVVAGNQTNRYCGSGLEAVNQAAARIRSGWEDLVLAGGVESMSRVPMGSGGDPSATDPETAMGLGFVPQGIGADLIATTEGFTRDDVDRFAVESQERAAKAWADGRFDRSIVPVVDRAGTVVLDRDEHMRPGTTLDDLARLKPSFAGIGEMGGFDDVALAKYTRVERIDHVHHAGNSSGIVDGAALVVVGSEEAGRRHDLTPRAVIRSAAVVGTDPTIMLVGPGPACRKALDRAGMTMDDIDLVEINEAFAAVALKLMRDLGVERDVTNVNGGAIAMGHPLGATGAMLLGTMVDELERRDLSTAIVTLCIGGGMGIATIIERV